MMRRVSIFAFCQGTGWEVMRRLPFIDGLAENRAAVRPILSADGASLPTVLTGALPQEHHHWGWFTYSPESSPFRSTRYLAKLPRSVQWSERFRHGLVAWFRKATGIKGRLSLFNLPLGKLPYFAFAERHDPLAPRAYNHSGSLIDFLEQNRLPYYRSSFDATDAENINGLLARLNSQEIIAAFVVLGSVATALKAAGIASPEVRGRTAWLDHRLRQAYEIAAQNYEEVDLIAFSDTGMIPVTDRMDLQGEMGRMPYEFGTDYVALYEATLARFWFLTAKCRGHMLRRLESLPSGRILTDEELEREGCYFPDGRFGQTIFIAKAGTIFSPNDIEQAPLKATGGYLPDTPGLSAGFACNLREALPPVNFPDIHRVLMESAASSAGMTRPAAIQPQKRG